MIWAGNKSSWDFLNPQNFIINKSPQQNLKEMGTGLQILGTVIPEAIAFKTAQQIVGQVMLKQTAQAVTTTTTTAGATAGAGAVVGGGTLAGTGLGLTVASLVPLATTGLKVGAGLTALQWLEKNWWIPALFLGGYILLKHESGGRK